MRSSSRLFAFAAVLFVSGSAAAVDYVNDPLTDPNYPGRGSQGGTFGPEGWTTVGQTDAIWYEIPDAIPTGKIQFTVRGMSVGGSLIGADHDIFAMYQAPTGQAEPVKYSPYFRNNDFKVFTRVFGTAEPDRPGAMKVEFAVCPRGEPWHHDEPCTEGCGTQDLAYANGQAKDIGWDGAADYVIAIEWGNGKLSFSRDGTKLGEVQYEGTYAPKPLRVRLGSPRHGISDVAFMPIGLTFKDVTIQGEPGPMTLVCGAEEPPDAGPPPDAGASETDAGVSASELPAIQDVTAAAWVEGVFEDTSDLNVEGSDDGEPRGVVYLRFPLVEGVVKKAILRLKAHDYGSASGGSGAVHGVSDTTWSETTMTWDTRPPWDSTPHGVAQSVDPGDELAWDVTALVALGTVNFALVSSDPDGSHFVSKEAGGAATGPRLYIEVEPKPPGPSAGSGAGGAGGGTSSGAGAGSTGSGATTGGSGGATGASGAGGQGLSGNPASDGSGDSGSGCSCRVEPSGAASATRWVALIGAAAVALRRRRRARSS